MPIALLPEIGPTELAILSWIACVIWPACRICHRAGYPGILGLLAIVPLVNVGLLFWLAYADWPALRRPRPRD